ncbi:diguanylate cyclase [Halorhodospira neutriphila]|uniref:diguanylate cyclase n=1 Tax=Halorhodospira neutriphila TaxID=168379 RepID=A0ABS1E3Z7_9GAMM|nr:diguanylate cyclase [Halorhodospira neutriphila]MBK1726200.1 hypothetical protein [Halorhodospira neutriphila]
MGPRTQHHQPDGQRYRAAFEQSRDAIMFLEPHGYRDCNPATLRLFGVPDVATFLTTHPGKQLSPPLQPDGRPSAQAAAERIEQAYRDGYAFFEWQHRTLDGAEFPTEVSLSRIDQAGGPILQVIVRDISERKRMEAELRREVANRRQYQAAFEQSRDAIMLLDADGFRDCNPATLTMFRVPDSAAFRRTHPADLSPLFQPDGRASREASAAYIDEALRRGEAFFAWQHCTWDGDTFPAEVLLSRVELEQGAILQAVVRDISERTRMERDLEQKEAHYRLAQSSARFGIWEWDLEQDRIHWDPDCWAMLGYPPETDSVLSTAAWRGMIAPSDLARVEPEIRRKQATGERFSLELRCRRADGGWLWIQCRGQTTAFRGDGSAWRITGTHVDIDRLKATETQLRERIKEMELLTEVIRLAFDETLSSEEMLQAVARALPNGWQAPGSTAARIRGGGVEATSEPFFEAERRQAAVSSQPSSPVQVEIFRQDKGPPHGADFLPEEQQLLEAVTEEIGQALRHREAQQALQRQATVDPLTGVFNRQRFEAELERTLARHERYSDTAAIAMLDIDHFKAVNDAYGHNVGDRVLREVAERISEALRLGDTLGRWGGEEFLILLPGTGLGGARRAAERFRARIEAAPLPPVGRVTISLGVTAIRGNDSTTGLLARVDEALYEAKNCNGRNSVAAR